MRRKAILLILVLFLGAVSLLFWEILIPVKSDQMVIHVRSGTSAASISEQLKANGVINSSYLFQALATIRGTDRRLIAGSYTLGGKNSLYQTLILLEKGNTSAVRITFPEGLSLHKTLLRIEKSGLASDDELYAVATDSSFVLKTTGFAVPSLEGFLYPETYAFDIASTPQDILNQMTSMFFAKMAEARIDPMRVPDFYDKLKLASIVEKESGQESEKPVVASVLENRLGRGMKLGSCATVDYVLEKTSKKNRVLSLKEVHTSSSYNTYLNEGLPPGPICNPSVSSIQAALNPAQTAYLYFVADRKGHNDFSKTAEEHMAKSRKYHRVQWE
jgi:UPF0755 protein